MKDFFPESLGQKHGCSVYMGAHYTCKYMVLLKVAEIVFSNKIKTTQ